MLSLNLAASKSAFFYGIPLPSLPLPPPIAVSCSLVTAAGLFPLNPYGKLPAVE